jgi:hypothetical protein
VHWFVLAKLCFTHDAFNNNAVSSRSQNAGKFQPPALGGSLLQACHLGVGIASCDEPTIFAYGAFRNNAIIGRFEMPLATNRLWKTVTTD